jgi:uncharacterized protein involved in cysteine biosynthesis
MTTTPADSAVSAAALALRGLRLALATPAVRRVYLQLALALLLTSAALTGLLAWLAWTLLPTPEPGWSTMSAVYWALRIAGLALAAIAAPLIALFVVNIAFPFLGERVFLAGLRAADPERAAELEAAAGGSFTAGVAASVRRLVYYVGVTLLILALALVPVVGAVLGPLAQLWFTARMLSWELLDPYFERRGQDYAAQRRTLTQHRGAMFGFGLPWTLLLGLPVVGPLGFGLAQAAAALLVTRVLEPRPPRA